MMRWFLVILLALLLFNALMPWLAKLGIGRLPGDLHFKLFGREWNLPIASSLLLSAVAAFIGKLL